MGLPFMHIIDSGHGSVIPEHDRHAVKHDSLGVAEGARESTAGPAETTQRTASRWRQ
jgi:hypothetical protein